MCPSVKKQNSINKVGQCHFCADATKRYQIWQMFGKVSLVILFYGSDVNSETPLPSQNGHNKG